mmetsp:Transcript_35345/g.109071  ORF Transcript_35345/g.109071 Transcript_35345/m.109071 type:complete len:201 (+) Transcript_35345:895-1497(+)
MRHLEHVVGGRARAAERAAAWRRHSDGAQRALGWATCRRRGPRLRRPWRRRRRIPPLDTISLDGSFDLLPRATGTRRRGRSLRWRRHGRARGARRTGRGGGLVTDDDRATGHLRCSRRHVDHGSLRNRRVEEVENATFPSRRGCWRRRGLRRRGGCRCVGFRGLFAARVAVLAQVVLAALVAPRRVVLAHRPHALVCDNQ